MIDRKTINFKAKKNHKIKTLMPRNLTETISNIQINNKKLKESKSLREKKITSTNQSPFKNSELNSKRQAETKSNSIKNKRKNNSNITKIIRIKAMDKNKSLKEAILTMILVNKWHIHHGKQSNNLNKKFLLNLSKERKYYSDLLFLIHSNKTLKY